MSVYIKSGVTQNSLKRYTKFLASGLHRDEDHARPSSYSLEDVAWTLDSNSFECREFMRERIAASRSSLAERKRFSRSVGDFGLVKAAVLDVLELIVQRCDQISEGLAAKPKPVCVAQLTSLELQLFLRQKYFKRLDLIRVTLDAARDELEYLESRYSAQNSRVSSESLVDKRRRRIREDRHRVVSSKPLR